MDSAREISTGIVVSGVDLYLLDEDKIDKDNYQCWGCDVPVNPVSYKVENKKCAHFRLFKDLEHVAGCALEMEDSEDEIYRRRVPRPDGLPRPYPSRLVINRKRAKGRVIVVENTPDDPIGDILRGGHVTQRTRHHFSVGTIRPLAKHYVNRPSERHLPVKVFDSDDETFDSLFAEIPNQVNVRLPHEQIYFGILYFSAKTVEDDKFVEVKLARGKWENNKLAEAYTVRINTEGWSDRAKWAVIREINETRSAYREAYKNGDRSSHAWLFFIAEQDPQRPALLHVKLHQHVCCFIATLHRSRRYTVWQTLSVPDSSGASLNV